MKKKKNSEFRFALCLLCLLVVAGTTAGCESVVDPPTPPLGPNQAVADFSITAAWTGVSDLARTYYCTVSRRMDVQQSDDPTYEYGLIRLVFPKVEYEEAEGQRNRFLVYVRDEDGIVEWASWCDVPRSETAMTRVLARLGLNGRVKSTQAAHDSHEDGEFSTFSEPVRDEQCPWEDSYYSEEHSSCVIKLDGVSGGGSPSPPPPDWDDDWDSDWDGGDWGGGDGWDEGGGSDGGTGTPPAPPSRCEGSDCDTDESEGLAPCPPSIAGNTHLYLRALGRSTPIGPFVFHGPHENQSYDGSSSTGVWRPYGIDPVDLSDDTRWMARGVFVAVCERTILGVRIRPVPNEDPRDGSTEFYGEVWRVW